MNKNDNRPIIVIGIIILAVFFFQYSDFFGINLSTSQVQYNNDPIEARFTLTNFSSPNITGYLNDVELLETSGDDPNMTDIYSKDIVNGTYILKLTTDKTGVFKFVADEGNKTETQIIEVRKPFIDIKHNVPNIVNEGESLNLQIKTYTPQGAEVPADSV